MFWCVAPLCFNLLPLVDEEVVVDNGGGASEAHILYLMTNSENECDDERRPF